MKSEQPQDLFTPKQAADYLLVNRETVYRYIREGKLAASRLGRTYRIPRSSIEMFLWAARTHEDIALREYSGREIEQFIRRDKLDARESAIANQFLASVAEPRSKDGGGKSKHRVNRANLGARALSPGEFITTVLPDHVNYGSIR